MKKPRLALWKRLLRLAAFALVALVTLAALMLSIISFQGRREWVAVRQELLARGEKLSLVELAPPPIPDEQNFFADPMWTELFDLTVPAAGSGIPEPRVPKGKRILDVIKAPAAPELVARAATLIPKDRARFTTDLATSAASIRSSALTALSLESDPERRAALAQLLLDDLQPAAPILENIHRLLDRPGARTPGDYSKGFPQGNITAYSYLLTLAQSLSARATASLALGRSDQAATDLLDVFRLARTVRSEPTLIAQLVRDSIAAMPATAIATGSRKHAWTTDQLLRFESTATAEDLPRGMALALRGERGNSNQFMEALRSSQPEQNAAAGAFAAQTSQSVWGQAIVRWGITLDAGDQALFNRWMQAHIDALDRALSQGLHPRQIEELEAQFSRKDALWRLRHPLLNLASPAIARAVSQAVWCQDRLRQLRIACALERYWLKTHPYPDSLAALTPKFLPEVPADVIDGQAFHYRREGADAFRLWSVGWNETDDGGSPSSTRAIDKDGDWVWDKSPRP